jgi:hypothetical protein
MGQTESKYHPSRDRNLPIMRTCLWGPWIVFRLEAVGKSVVETMLHPASRADASDPSFYRGASDVILYVGF